MDDVSEKIAKVAENYKIHQTPVEDFNERQIKHLKQYDPTLIKLTENIGEFNKSFDKPQYMTIDEFSYFEPLFIKEAADKYSPRAYAEIQEEYHRRVDLYRPLHIITSEENPKLLMTFPRRFMPFRSITNVKDTAWSGMNNRTDQQLTNKTIMDQDRQAMRRLIHETNIADPANFKKISDLKLETYELLIKFQKMKADMLQNNDDSSTSSHEESKAGIDVGFIDD